MPHIIRFIPFICVFAGLLGHVPLKFLSNLKLTRADVVLTGISRQIFMYERWLSVEEIAAHLGLNPDTIYKWITRKSMPAHKLGRLWKFLASEVDQWVKGGLAGEDAKPTAKRKISAKL